MTTITNIHQPARIMAQRQTRLAGIYQHSPKSAWITDAACTASQSNTVNDPLPSSVTMNGVEITIGVHQAVGGEGDAPCPGELLSAALPSCVVMQTLRNPPPVTIQFDIGCAK